MEQKFTAKQSAVVLFHYRKQHLFKKITIVLTTALTAFLVSSPTAKETMPRIKDKWLTVHTPDYRLYSQVDAKKSAQALAYFEYLRRSLFVMVGRRATTAPMPTHIYLFKDKKSYNTFKPTSVHQAESKQGHWLQRADGNYLLRNEAERATDEIAQTYARYLIRTHFSRVPIWFEQGFASYLSAFKADGKEVTIGMPLAQHLSSLRFDDGMSYDALLRLSSEAIALADKKNAKQWPAQSWLLVHYLFHGQDGAMRLKIDDFLKALADGIPSADALRSVFNLEVEMLQSILKDYARQPQHGFLTMAVGELMRLKDPEIEPMTEERTLYHLGDLLAQQDETRRRQAEAYFQSALALRPAFAASYGGLAFLCAQRQDATQAIAYYTRAIAANAADAQMYYRFASTLLQNAGREENSPKPELILQARGYLQRAIDLDDDYTASYALYGKTFLYDMDGSLHSGITALEKALTRMPAREDIAVDLLCLYALDGDTLRANYHLQEIIGRRWDKAVLSQAREKMVRLQLTRAQRWLDEEKYAQVIGLLRYAQPFASAESQLAKVQELLGIAGVKRQAECYHSAVARAKSGDDATAVECLSEAMALDADARVTASSRTLFAQVGKRLQLELYSDAMMKMNGNKLKQAETLLLRAIALNVNPEITGRAKRLLKTVRAAM